MEFDYCFPLQRKSFWREIGQWQARLAVAVLAVFFVAFFLFGDKKIATITAVASVVITHIISMDKKRNALDFSLCYHFAILVIATSGLVGAIAFFSHSHPVQIAFVLALILAIVSLIIELVMTIEAAVESGISKKVAWLSWVAKLSIVLLLIWLA